jgi:hypothetical protein
MVEVEVKQTAKRDVVCRCFAADNAGVRPHLNQCRQWNKRPYLSGVCVLSHNAQRDSRDVTKAGTVISSISANDLVREGRRVVAWG